MAFLHDRLSMLHEWWNMRLADPHFTNALASLCACPCGWIAFASQQDLEPSTGPARAIVDTSVKQPVLPEIA